MHDTHDPRNRATGLDALEANLVDSSQRQDCHTRRTTVGPSSSYTAPPPPHPRSLVGMIRPPPLSHNGSGQGKGGGRREPRCGDSRWADTPESPLT